MSDIRLKTIKGIQKGDRFEVTRTFSKEDVEAFAQISRDDNPIHSNPEFIQSKQMKGPICHGLLVASILTEIGGQIGWLASGMEMKFKKPVYIGEKIRCEFEIIEIADNNKAQAQILFFNSNNEIVLEAVLKGILPNPRERDILKKLL